MQAERIYHTLRQGDDLADFLKIKQTRNGENRLKNIEKYDLGAGYRLICRKAGRQVSLEFIGTHDKSDVWINHHRRAGGQPSRHVHRWSVEPLCDSDRCRIGPMCYQEAKVDTYEEDLLNRIDDQTLRHIFSGLAAVDI